MSTVLEVVIRLSRALSELDRVSVCAGGSSYFDTIVSGPTTLSIDRPSSRWSVARDGASETVLFYSVRVRIVLCRIGLYETCYT